MPLEVFSFIPQLVATNPLGTDPKALGDDHIRGIKATLQNQFPNFTGEALTMTEEQLNDLVAAIFIASNGNIGMGELPFTPEYQVHIKGADGTLNITRAVDSAAPPRLRLRKSRALTDAESGDTLGEVVFEFHNSIGIQQTGMAITSTLVDNTTAIEDVRTSFAQQVGGVFTEFMLMLDTAVVFGKNVLSFALPGVELHRDGLISATRSGGVVQELNRQGGNGDIAMVFADSSEIGGFGVVLGELNIKANAGLRINGTATVANSTGPISNITVVNGLVTAFS